MSHCIAMNIMQATLLSAHNYSFYGFSWKPFSFVQHNESFLCPAKFKCGAIPSSWIGSLEGLRSTTLKSWCKAKVFDTEEVFPPVQTLRRFPVEELSSKVVLVRFDSSILLQQKLERSFTMHASALLTIKYLHEVGAKVILVSSWNIKHNSEIISEDAVAEVLSSALELKVIHSKHISGHQTTKMEQHERADIVLQENLFKYKQELANNSEFSRRLASGVDIFVNDSFSSAHKILASTVGVTQFCSYCLAGFYFEECLYKLKKIPECNSRPCVAVVGGGNIADKAAAVQFLADKCDGLIFVGTMAFQIMHALGYRVPSNLVEQQGIKEAVETVKFATQRSIPILLPKDFWCKHNHLQIHREILSAQDMLDGWVPVDLGPITFIEIASFLSGCKKIMWIGQVNFIDSGKDAGGATKLAMILDKICQNDCHISIIGHMSCEAVVRTSRPKLAYDMIEHASVVWEFLKGRKLYGLLALDRAYPFDIDWNTIYQDPTQPLAVDIGSGNGLFLLGMSTMLKDLNFLGLEINEKLVIRCQESAHQSSLRNLHFIATNAASSFRDIVSSYPGPVILVSIQCPNPDFNQPEHRWRMVQRSLVEAIADKLTPGGKLFLQSDVEEVALRMRLQFLNEGKGKLSLDCDDDNATMDSEGWLIETPFGVQSDWERHVLARGAPMYRLMFCKKHLVS